MAAFYYFQSNGILIARICSVAVTREKDLNKWRNSYSLRKIAHWTGKDCTLYRYCKDQKKYTSKPTKTLPRGIDYRCKAVS